ncbi:MAG: hypothetical protein H7Z42_17005 [Roseiflexaceae bacterium]|nr:hypothetical protein [Roseiflexaceae bacterium]
MPRVRKLTADEVLLVEVEHHATARAWMAASRLADQKLTQAPRQPRFVRTTPPRIGDVVDLPDRLRGIVIQVHRAQDGSWGYAEVFVRRSRRWYYADHIGPVVGRPVGISRIDHPRKRTYGWFVRGDKGKRTQYARFFSDMKYGGRAAALGAALAYQQATISELADFQLAA